MAEKKKPKEERFDIGIGLGGLFKGLGNIVDLVQELSEKGEKISRRGEFKVKGLGEKAKGVYGFTVRMGIGGEPIVEEFGNIRETKAGPVVEEEREPLVDVFDEKERVLVIAELPGIEEENIKLETKEDILIISATDKDRKYSREVVLPTKVDLKEMQKTYKNGVLEIVFPKPKKKAPKRGSKK